MQADQTTETIAVILAIAAFVLIALIGMMTDILKETPHPDNPGAPPYSLSRLQLFLWTLIIAPVFALHWGVTGEVTLNDTGLILLGISATVMVTASAISGAQQSTQAPAPATTTTVVQQSPATSIAADDGTVTSAPTSVAATTTTVTTPVSAFKAKLPSRRFWVDIIMDDNGQLSLARLQQLVFTMIYATVYLTTFFGGAMKAYPDFQANAYILMGISSGSYLLGKSLNK
ncbi:hypothetical protein HYN48_06530 [Flavobacterium magnum]|uniref:Uncharacterized protein n=1 Tax=Flavobacterium magnum TaxID=2162713 RepID=A0A2S0RE06_9FLAO|nr:hypothetical protein [Flavobacterium magnum]AWA29759.1 hypothetical protein HYN48_06530 [Flavobacterium magnum]